MKIQLENGMFLEKVPAVDLYNLTFSDGTEKIVDFDEMDGFPEPDRTFLENAMCELDEAEFHEGLKCEYWEDGLCFFTKKECNKVGYEREECPGRDDGDYWPSNEKLEYYKRGGR